MVDIKMMIALGLMMGLSEDEITDTIARAMSLAEIKQHATAAEKAELYHALQDDGEDCPNCKGKDKCPVYDALMK